MQRRPWIVLFALIGLALSGCTSGGKSSASENIDLPKEAVLRLQGKVGDTFTLSTTLETEAEITGPDGKAQKGTMTLISTERHTCEKVEGGRQSWRVQTVKSEGSGTGPLAAEAEKVKAQQAAKNVLQTKDDRNRVLDAGADESLALTFPENAIKPGDSWTGETSLMGAKMQIKFTLERFEAVSGKAAAVIAASVSGGDKVKIAKPVMIFVDVTTGWPLKGVAAFEMNPMPGVTSTMKVDMKAQ